MNNRDEWSIILLVVLVLGIILGSCVVNTYKHGQIDAINGIIEYELREMDDGEMKWKRIKEQA